MKEEPYRGWIIKVYKQGPRLFNAVAETIKVRDNRMGIMRYSKEGKTREEASTGVKKIIDAL